MVLDTSSSSSQQNIPEELYNLTQLADVTLAAGRLSTTNVNEITEYINKEKSKQQIDSTSLITKENEYFSMLDNCGKGATYRRRHTMQDNWNRNIEDIRDDLLLTNTSRSVQDGIHSVIKRNHSTPTILEYNNEVSYSTPKKDISERITFLSSSDDDSNYYSHKIFDRKKSRRSTISDNSKHDEHSCSSIPSSGDEHYIQNLNQNHQNDSIHSGVSGSSSSDDDHICPECGKKYSTSSNLARHRQTHRSILDKKARRCPHCDKVYVSMPAYSMHVRTHNQGCECPHCGKCFSRPWLLQGHIRTHTGEKPFKCNICAKAFADKSNLRAHVQTHSNTKPHACTRCGKAFALKSYLYKHEESSCMRNHMKHEKDRGKVSKIDATRNNLVSKILRKEIVNNNSNTNENNQIHNQHTNEQEPTITEPIMLNPSQAHDSRASTKSEVITEENTQKSYTMLTSPMSQDDFDRFSRISVIRTPHASQTTINTNQSGTTSGGGGIYEANSLQLNFYQENPVDFSPKNNFTHSSKTSPFELTGSYAIVA